MAFLKSSVIWQPCEFEILLIPERIGLGFWNQNRSAFMLIFDTLDSCGKLSSSVTNTERLPIKVSVSSADNAEHLCLVPVFSGYFRLDYIEFRQGH